MNYNPAGKAVCVITAQNEFSATSSYATISTPPSNSQSGDWTFDNLQIHDMSARSGGFSSVLPLYISGSFSKLTFNGGLIAGSVGGSDGGTVTLNAVNGGVSFLGTGFYADLGGNSNYCFFARASTAGLVVKNCNIAAAYAVFGVASTQGIYRLEATGNPPYTVPTGIFMAAVNSGPGYYGALQFSIVDAQGLSINLGPTGGYLTNTVVLQHGSITAATQTNNGLF
jgi:hypothetical protein